MIALFALAAAAAPYANMPQDISIQAVHNFGECVVKRTPRGAREVLSLDYNSPEYDKELRSYIRGHDYCMPFNGAISSREVLFAGALAEAMLKMDVRSSELPQRLAYDPQRQMIAARGPAEAMALCTDFAAPQVTVRIFQTEPATPEESAAMQPLGGVLTDCLKKGAQVTINKPALRSLLALAAWRIVNTPRKPVS